MEERSNQIRQAAKKLEKTANAGLILIDSHSLQAYAAALGAFESKGIASFMKDLHYHMKPVLAIDAKAPNTTSTDNGMVDH